MTPDLVSEICCSVRVSLEQHPERWKWCYSSDETGRNSDALLWSPKPQGVVTGITVYPSSLAPIISVFYEKGWFGRRHYRIYTGGQTIAVPRGNQAHESTGFDYAFRSREQQRVRDAELNENNALREALAAVQS